MAKTGSEFGYYWDFTLPTSPDEFQLVMIPSDNDSVAISSYKKQDNVAIEEAKLNYEYDKYPFGSTNPTLDLSINLEYCSDTLQSLLLNPFYDNSLSLFSSPYTQTLNFRHGNYWDLRVKKKTTGDYVSVWQGVTSEIEVELIENKLKVTIESLGKYVFSNISIDIASHVYTTGTGNSKGQFYDYAFRFGSLPQEPYYIYSDLGWSNNPKYYGWISSLSDLNSFWQTISNYIVALVTRDWYSGVTFNLDLFSVVARGLGKQTFDGETDLPFYEPDFDRLTPSTTYVITHISKYEYSDRATTDGYNDVKNSTGGGLFYVLKSNYTTLWDFITEYCEANLLRMYNRNGITLGHFLGKNNFSSTDNFTLDLRLKDVYNLKVDLCYEVLKEVSSQYLDDTARNTKEFVSRSSGANKNANNYTLVQGLSTKALYPDENTFEQRHGASEYLSYTKQVNNTQYYYFPGNAEIIDADGNALGRTGFILKVGDIPTMYLNSQETIEMRDYYDPINPPIGDYTELKETDSSHSNNALATASVMRILFDVGKQNKITFDILFDDFYCTRSTVDYNLSFYMEYGALLFDLLDANANFNSYTINYMISKMELDLINLKANVEAVSRSL